MRAGYDRPVQPYVWFDAPRELSACLGPDLAKQFSPFSLAVGHTHFGDLFLRNPATGELGVLTQGTCTLFDTGYFDDQEYRTEYLATPGIVEHVLRPADVAQLERRLGQLAPLQVFLPVPIRALGGSDELDTYEPGGLWEYLSFVMQTIGLTRDLATEDER